MAETTDPVAFLTVEQSWERLHAQERDPDPVDDADNEAKEKREADRSCRP